MSEYLTDRAQASPDELINEVRAIARSARHLLPTLAAAGDQRGVAYLTAVADELDYIADTVEGRPQEFRRAISEVAGVLERCSFTRSER